MPTNVDYVVHSRQCLIGRTWAYQNDFCALLNNKSIIEYELYWIYGMEAETFGY